MLLQLMGSQHRPMEVTNEVIRDQSKESARVLVMLVESGMFKVRE